MGALKGLEKESKTESTDSQHKMPGTISKSGPIPVPVSIPDWRESPVGESGSGSDSSKVGSGGFGVRGMKATLRWAIFCKKLQARISSPPRSSISASKSTTTRTSDCGPVHGIHGSEFASSFSDPSGGLSDVLGHHASSYESLSHREDSRASRASGVSGVSGSESYLGNKQNVKALKQGEHGEQSTVPRNGNRSCNSGGSRRSLDSPDSAPVYKDEPSEQPRVFGKTGGRQRHKPKRRDDKKLKRELRKLRIQSLSTYDTRIGTKSVSLDINMANPFNGSNAMGIHDPTRSTSRESSSRKDTNFSVHSHVNCNSKTTEVPLLDLAKLDQEIDAAQNKISESGPTIHHSATRSASGSRSRSGSITSGSKSVGSRSGISSQLDNRESKAHRRTKHQQSSKPVLV
eukprot:145030-Amorphochlora_amoeboformis.AAC.1